MRELAGRLLKTIRKEELLRAGERVAVAVSGGADSVALLLLLVELRAELGIVLSVAHANHKLRGAESDGDEDFVAALAAEHRLEIVSQARPVERVRGAGVESVARRLRYEFLSEVAQSRGIAKVATAHTLDDQAETVLLRMFRGTGIRGLAGIHPRLRLTGADPGSAEVVRPLLGFRRAELRAFLEARGQRWREDSSNEDLAFLRNRVRRLLLPIIAEEFGDAAIEHMAELAEIARAEEEWAVINQPGLPRTQTTLGVDELLLMPLAARRRIVRSWIGANAPQVAISFRLVEEILELAKGAAGKTAELPGGKVAETGATEAPQMSVRRTRDELVLERIAGKGGDYEYVLPVPGEVFVPELGASFKAEIVDVKSFPESGQDELLNATNIGTSLIIRNWRAGDRFWPAHTKEEKKVKELLNDRYVTGTDKKLWPVAEIGGEIVWMRGFMPPEALRAQAGKAIWIREVNARDTRNRLTESDL